MSNRTVQSFVSQKENPVSSVKVATRNRAAAIDKINAQCQKLYNAFIDEKREWKPSSLRKIAKSLNAFQSHLAEDRVEIMKDIASVQNAEQDPTAEMAQLEDNASLAANVDSLLVTARTSLGEELKEEDLVLVDDSGVVQEEEPMVDKVSEENMDMENMEEENMDMENMEEEMDNDSVDLDMEIDEGTTDAEIAGAVREAYKRLKARKIRKSKKAEGPHGSPVERHPDDPKPQSAKKASELGMPEGQPVDQHAEDLPDVPETGNPEKVTPKMDVPPGNPDTAKASAESMEEDEFDFSMEDELIDDFMMPEEENAGNEEAKVDARASVSNLRRRYANKSKKASSDDSKVKDMFHEDVLGNF